MSKYLLLATVKDRHKMIPPLLESINKYLPDWHPVIVMQDYKKEYSGASCITIPRRIGPHNAKLIGLRYINQLDREYVVCSIDDDMEFTAKTNLNPCVSKAMDSEVGLVSAGWARSEKIADKKTIVDKFIRQHIVYTGGGLIFRKHIANLIREIPPGNYFCDNTMWSLATYLNGYVNYRYCGSITIHRVCGSGGRKAWIKDAKYLLPPKSYISFKQGKRDDYLIGSYKLTDKARRMHDQNHRRLS